MVKRKEQETLIQNESRQQLLHGRIDRREFVSRSLVAGLGMAGVGVAAKYGVGSALAQDRPLTPTFYDWIGNLHPSIPAVNARFPGVNYQIAPVQGFGIERQPVAGMAARKMPHQVVLWPVGQRFAQRMLGALRAGLADIRGRCAAGQPLLRQVIDLAQERRLPPVPDPRPAW